MAASVFATARSYIDAGLGVIPIKRDGTKEPESSLLPRVDKGDGKGPTPSWDHFKERLATSEEIKTWFDRPKPPGIAIINGKVSVNLETMDFDREAERTFPEWCRLVDSESPGLIDRLSTSTTPKPGFHVRYRCSSPIPGSHKLAMKPGIDPKTGKPTHFVLVETRGEGGYALAPGCPVECNPTGKPYAYHSGPAITQVGVISKDERDILIRCAKSLDQRVHTEYQPKSSAAFPRNDDGRLTPWDDFNARADWKADVLGPHDWTFAWESAGEGYWRRPGKDEGSCSATTGLRSRCGKDLLYVFSTNAHPLNEGTSYTKFAAYAILTHNGNFKAAARAIVAKGYGEQKRMDQQILYRLPELHAADPKEIVWLVDGEAEADTLRELAFVATSNPMGTSKGKWLNGHTETLRGRSVVILSNNDPASIDHAKEVFHSIKRAARSVVIVELPGIPPNGSILDWFDGGGNAKDLARLGKEALEAAHASNGHSVHVELVQEEWTEPIPLVDAQEVQLPLNSLPRCIRQFAEETALAMPCPVDLVAIACLTAAATAIGTSRQVRIKSGWVEGPRLWTAIVCDPGTMKSPALQRAMEPLRALQRRWKSEFDRETIDHERESSIYDARVGEFKANVKDAVKNNEDIPEMPPKPDAPKFRQCMTTNTTLESLCPLLHDNPRGLVLCKDELTGWVRSLNEYKGGKGSDRQEWLSLWSGADIIINRKGKTTFVANPLVNVVGCLPPDVLGELNDEYGREDGFIHRILFAWPASQPAHFSDLEVYPDTSNAYGNLFDRLFALHPVRSPSSGELEPETLCFQPDARGLFIEFVDSLAGEQTIEGFQDCYRGVWSKLKGYCARLALVVHVCRAEMGETDNQDIDANSTEAAIALIDYFKGQAKRVYPKLLANRKTLRQKDAQAVLEWIRRAKDRFQERGTFSWRDVRHDLRVRFNDRTEELAQALKLLEDRGYLDEFIQEKKQTGRRQSAVFCINPSTWGQVKHDSRNGERDGGLL